MSFRCTTLLEDFRMSEMLKAFCFSFFLKV